MTTSELSAELPSSQIEQRSSTPKDELRDWVGFGFVAILGAAFLSMVATCFLVADYPTPVDDLISLGFFGFLFVMLLDFAVIYKLASSKTRQGQRRAAVKWSVSLILIGLLAALVAGSLPWCWHRLIAAMPWVPELPWGAFQMLWLWFVANLLRNRRQAHKAV